MKKILLLLLVFVGLNTSIFGFATLATAFKGGDEISFNSNVSNVEVKLNGNTVGEINGTFSYKVNRDGQVKVFTFVKPGYKTQKVTLTTSLDNFFWGNLIFFGAGIFGSSVDSWFTNNSQQYSPNQYFINLKKG